MPEKPSSAQIRGRIGAFLFLLTSLLVYPAILMATRDIPLLPRLTFRRFLDAADLSHFRFEPIVLGVSFIVLFLLPVPYLLAEKLVVRFVLASSVTAGLVYVLGLSFGGEVYPISILRDWTLCPSDQQICYSFGVHGYLIFVALACGIAVARILCKSRGST